MTELVFLDPPAMQSTPFTTSEVIAEYAGVRKMTAGGKEEPWDGKRT